MSGDIFSFDPVMANGYSDAPRFDMGPTKSWDQAAEMGVDSSTDNSVNPELSLAMTPTKEWETDVRALISTKKWLSIYGLKKNRLDMFHIMPQIGFKHSEDYDHFLKKPVSSKYATGMFQKFLRSDGKMFNVSCSKEKLRQIEHRLTQAMALYKRRLDWLTSESRRIFGTVEEKSVCIVVDSRNLSPKLFDQFRTGLERVIREQVSTLAKFNIIRACEDLEVFSKDCVPVTMETINSAVTWLWELSRAAPVSNTSTCEAVLQAMADKQIEAIYLYTEGSSSDTSRELLKEKLSGSRIPTHIVSFNCTKADTVKSLKDLSRITGGRFHAYAVVMELDTYEVNDNPDVSTRQSNVILKKKTYGGVPAGAGMREDVILVFEELEEARNALIQVQEIIASMPDPRASIESFPRPVQTTESANSNHSRVSDRSETYMSSREWLNKYGLRAKKLGFYDVLAGVAFKHRDGVVELKQAPDGQYQTDALRRDKLINARYCDKFPHVRWKDGQVVHVQVTPEMHRSYEQRVNLTLNAVQQRIDWLQQGSRELFGTVIEDQIYILIDTSASMSPHIQFVKDKLFVLMQEQLRHKQKFNLIAFDSNSVPWQSRLVDVNEKNLHHAWQWIKGLSCRGSTNTLAALRHALSDPQTQSVYLLTDGRPDQPPKSILAQIMLHPQVPVHTISFNCSDRDANQFLCQLSKDTSGRFHYYSENGIDPEGPEPWESEDIRLLRLELEQGYTNLEKIATLRDECAALAWRKDDTKKDSSPPGLKPKDYFSGGDNRSSGPGFSPAPPNGSSPRQSAPGGSRARLVVRPHTSNRSPRNTKSSRPLTAGLSRSLPNQAGHTRTSLLRTLNSSGQFDQEWLLPETRELFDRQLARQLKSENDDERKLKRRNKQKKRYADPMLMSSRKWLSKNGLSALKLTILDALAPTFIPHTSTYVPILKQHVVSKVFDKILPFAHTNVRKSHHVGPERAKVNIINPEAVNLELYMSKVEKAAQRYESRLDALVWRALPDSAKENLNGSKSFLKNRKEMLEALNESGWGKVNEDDITLLETEIEQAWGYIQQAKGLLLASTKTNKEAESGESSSEMPPSSSRPSSARPNSGRLNGEKKKKVKKEKQTRRMLDKLRGQRVIGRNAEDGFYYAGSVTRCTDIRHAVTEYDELGIQKVPTRFLIPMSGAISVPHLMAGDYVLARVVNQETNLECYVPGVVQITPKVIYTKSKYFTVILYTGQKDHFLRSYLVKISKLRYLFIVRYIQDLNPAEQQPEEYEDDSDQERERSPSPPPPDDDLEKERLRLERWQRHLEDMQKNQRRDQKRLKRQARKLEKLRLRLTESHSHNDNEQRRLLELILQETKNREDDRTSHWVEDQNVEIALDEEKGDILVSSGDKGVLISRSEKQEDVMREMRRTLCRLEVGEEVLARWSDEGWYYRGTVKQQIEEGSYYIEDSVGNLEAIFREDIISDKDDANTLIKVKDTVVALHPNYMFSYAPGVVMETQKNSSLVIRFYDGHESRVAREEVYRVPAAKFELDVAYIIKCEAGWVGQAVVARNDDTGVFQLGVIRERIGDGRQYVVERSDGELAIQVATCIFGAFTKRHQLTIGDNTLAFLDTKSLVYLPGTVTDTYQGKLVVDFCNGTVVHDLDPLHCFWLSREYFKTAVDFYKQRQAAIAGGEAEGTVWTKNKERLTTKTTYEMIEEKVERVELKEEEEEEGASSGDDDRGGRQSSSRSDLSTSDSEDDGHRRGGEKRDPPTDKKADEFFD